MFSKQLLMIPFFAFCIGTVTNGMVSRNSFSYEQNKYYSSYTTLANDILHDFYKSDHALTPNKLLNTAELLGAIRPNKVLRRSDAQALSLLGSGNDNLLNAINKKEDGNFRTQTNAGILHLASLLTNPSCSESDINRDQACLKNFALNTALRSTVINTLATLKRPISYENIMFELFGKPREELPEVQRRHYFNMELLKNFNTNPFALNTAFHATRAYHYSRILMMSILLDPAMAAVKEAANNPTSITNFLKTTSQSTKASISYFLNECYKVINPFALYRAYQNQVAQNGALSGILQTGLTILTPISAVVATHGSNTNYKEFYNPGKEQIEHHIKDISTMIDAIETIAPLLDKAGLNVLHQEMHKLRTYLPYTALKEKLARIKSNTYLDSFLRPGRTLALYQELTQAYRNTMLCALTLLGKIDAYCALADYIAAHLKDEYKPISFVEFSDQQVTEVNLQKSWAPSFIGAKPVLNTIQLGNKFPRNMVLVAPNSSGKSSIMKTAMINAITAQVGGFVGAMPGSQISCFYELGSYMNIKEDPSAGLSTGAAQTAGLQGLKNMIGQEFDRFAKKLIIIDEPLSGTPEWLAQKFLCADAPRNPSLCSLLERTPHVISVIATHFKAINIADKPSFTVCNMQVDSDTKNKIFKPTYLLELGDHPWWFKEGNDAASTREHFANWYSDKIMKDSQL